MRGLPPRALTTHLDGYIESIVHHDLAEAEFTVRRPAAVRSWMRAYASATATTAPWETIRDAATAGIANKPAKETTATYSELLKMLRILDSIETWFPTRNHFSGLPDAPKHHLADPAIACRLLDRARRHLISGDEGQPAILRDGTLVGELS